ncbi:phenol-soluble modulin export ABC transporter permease subunit PmtB [Staphylococcus nepalensis]|uniref:phenol-soluble modulin export ABC transporter permease subunit PmtB n=1 Tax=Staphylococcus nepalensis TaxID=214473 RepID=UPI00383B48F1
MKNLLIRNLKLRKWTIAIYTVLLVASPLQLVLGYHTNLAKVLYSTLGMILVAISVLDSGHVFRFNSKLGHKHAYHFFASLPVSKLSLLNANYLTVIIFTLIGAGILSLYGATNNDFSKDAININFTLPFSYIAINLFAIPIGFKKYTEQKSEYISFIPYILGMLIFIPFLIAIMIIGYSLLFNYNFEHFKYFKDSFNYGFLALSIIFFVINYIIQYRKLT